MDGEKLSALARFLFEAQMMKRTPRTGFSFLGKGDESIAEHTCGVMINAFLLASLVDGVDVNRLLKICLIHDMAEIRTGDANAVYKLYVKMDEEKAFSDMLAELDDEFSNEIKDLYKEYVEAKTLEAKLAHDADQLDMILSLKVCNDTGCPDASIWFPYVKARLKTEEAKRLADAIEKEHWASWWMRLFGLNSKAHISSNKKEEKD